MVDVVADCHALQIGELHVKAGESRVFESFPAAVAIVFHQGEGTITIAGCVHAFAAGMVELVCCGESCAISASQDVHAFIIMSKATI